MTNKNYLRIGQMSAYEVLDMHFAKWTRISFDHIAVATLGYCNEHCMMLEDDLKRLGVYATKRRYNGTTGETITQYKLKGNFK